MSPPPVGLEALAWAALLVLANALLSLLLDLGLARTLVVGALRAGVQLSLVGLLLKTVFALASPLWVAGVLMLMLAAAGREVWARQDRRLRGLWGAGVGSGSTMLATLLVTGLALAALRPQPWYAAPTLIPLAGIVLGSVMNGVSLSLNALHTGVVRERAAIEARLALGATRRQALAPLQREAIRSGLIPIVNQMSAAGIITLPGMMTGQILAGLAPTEAARYQIFILFLLAGAAGLGAMAACGLAVWRLTDERDRLRLDRLSD
jgi:putative ABC transport system permease protein